MTTRWARVRPGCYAEELPLAQLWARTWPAGPTVGRYVAGGAGYLVLDGERWRSPLTPPTHWRALAAAPWGRARPRRSWSDRVAERAAAARAGYLRLLADVRNPVLSWSRIAERHGYKSGATAHASFANRTRMMRRCFPDEVQPIPDRRPPARAGGRRHRTAQENRACPSSPTATLPPLSGPGGT